LHRPANGLEHLDQTLGGGGSKPPSGSQCVPTHEPRAGRWSPWRSASLQNPHRGHLHRRAPRQLLEKEIVPALLFPQTLRLDSRKRVPVQDERLWLKDDEFCFHNSSIVPIFGKATIKMSRL